MTPPAVLRCLLATLVAFAVVALVFGGVLAGVPAVGSNGSFVFVGLAALLAPLAGTAVGAWQAHAAGVRRPIVGIAAAAAVALLVGLAIFGTNSTSSSSFDTLQPLLVLLGTIAGAVAYGVRWFGATARV